MALWQDNCWFRWSGTIFGFVARQFAVDVAVAPYLALWQGSLEAALTTPVTSLLSSTLSNLHLPLSTLWPKCSLDKAGSWRRQFRNFGRNEFWAIIHIGWTCMPSECSLTRTQNCLSLYRVHHLSLSASFHGLHALLVCNSVEMWVR